MRKLLSVLLALAMMAGFGAVMSHAGGDNDITKEFTDLNFRAAVLEWTEAVYNANPYWGEFSGIIEDRILSATGIRLDVSGRDIQSLNGINYFQWLEELNCSSNQLTEIPELRRALQINLKTLDCSDNQLTELDVTGLSLEYLDCSGNNMASPSAVKGFTGEWDGVNFIYEPQNVAQEQPGTHFWDNWPDWLVWVLKYIFFGWLWEQWL
ncbi:MAG: leucine-rich repeat domain-containing protein [Oscillospiraceae bacterium]|jgi:hypothetical protein|nr:leucine-rich repeat domain-containing protein [Oscillospiraceae bacterium]